VDKLPVVVSADHLLDKCGSEYQKVFGVVEFTYGGGNRTVRTYEDATMLEDQSHFRPEEFLILRDINRFEPFFRFVVNHLRGLTKLALIVDHEDYFHNDSLPRLLDSLPSKDSIKVLFISRTLRDGLPDPVPAGLRPVSKFLLIKQSLYSSILSLSSLEQLYFFPQEYPRIVISNRSPDKDHGGQFVNSILPRLTVFHFNSHINFGDEGIYENELYLEQVEGPFVSACSKLAVCYQFDAKVYPKLRELHCKCEEIIENVVDFPNLTTLYLNEGTHRGRHNGLSLLNFSALKSLKTLRSHRYLNVSVTADLNRLPSVETVQLRSLNDDDLGREKPFNRTVKHLLIRFEWIVSSKDRQFYDSIAKKYFLAHETCRVIQLPGYEEEALRMLARFGRKN